MARGSESLRQRAPILPVTMPSSDCESDDTSTNRRKPSRPAQTNKPQRRRRRQKISRRWEYLCQIIFVFLGLVFAIAILLNRRIHPHTPSIWSMLRAMMRMMPLPPIPQQAPNRVEYNFKCKSHPHIMGMLNDDYCDCLDGSDEPNTSACSNVLVGLKVFPCDQSVIKRSSELIGDDANRGSFEVDEGIMIFASRVRDGVIDCPNAADEENSTP
ncbi:hypothetical protein ACHAWO_006607 [Cyclotella atomus]|uniref:Glucosidase II beta subunit N-terminal domain-containing protein n=1 Tax=Cyclotella atomus TaxID=382360 RepID=A0ABD3NCR4_9STRA